MQKSEIPIVEIIIEYITDFCSNKETAVSILGTMLMIMKGTTPKKWEEVQSRKEGYIRGAYGPAVEAMDVLEFVKSWGKKLPVAYIIENDGVVNITYQKTLILDFRDPRFFDYLGLVLTHVLEQDDLAQFYL